jgi:uncharacterized membrane protein
MWGLFSTIISVPILLPIVSHIWIEKVGVDFDEIQSSPLYQMDEINHDYSVLLGIFISDDFSKSFFPYIKLLKK